MPSRTPASEPIPGYTLKERIGVGGYGEVWSAQAPGGLSKAVKLVYGHFDDERASRELKALNRIKEVRHPFLLSLERFEIIDGQLIIVSELADMSLKDRFEQTGADGHRHIPREELLGYLRDAADALDYMNDSFSLQHLDVKPENLLLVGGRVKVADFGLVKELCDVTSSMMGGLTPVYASPEVFDGRPSQRSDQYSLAIVFQEMLTGVLPFPGKTAAQLASQHVHSRPRLAPLTAGDQPIVARGLAKDPMQRFPSCRALVDALSGAAKPVARRAADPRPRTPQEQAKDTRPIRSRSVETNHDWQRASGKGEPESQNQKTMVIGPGGEHLADQGHDTEPVAGGRCSGVALPPPAPVEAPVDLGALELPAAGSALRPTLFLGIGGTAARTLRQLRRQLHDRFGADADLPALQMLLFDTDAHHLYEATQGDHETALSDSETMALPLRNARDYTAESPQKLAWLSRRWLYNIPRSLQTQGRRPLGRLALFDHAERVFERVRKALAVITSSDAMAKTAATTGLEFASRVPRVFVISSISGGTGSGMVLDVAYAVRTILADLGLADDGVCGLLTYSTDRNPTAADLATANAYACLSELYHYSAADCYPGDAAGGLPPFAASEGTFPHTYLVHLGEQLDDGQFDGATGALATYLYLNSVTPAASAFDACRAQPDATSDRSALGSFGLLRIGSQNTPLPALAVERLCSELVDRWRGAQREAPAAAPTSLSQMASPHDANTGPAAQPELEQPAEIHARGLGIDMVALERQVAALVELQLGGNSEVVCAELRSNVTQPADTHPVDFVRQMLAAIGNVFGPAAPEEGASKLPPAPIETALEDRLKQFARPLGVAVRDWIVGLVECPGQRVAAAVRAKKWYDGHLRAIEAQLVEEQREFQQAVPALERGLLAAAAEKAARKGSFFKRRPKTAAGDLETALVRLVELRCQQATGQALVRALRLLTSPIATAGDQLADLQRELGQLSAGFTSTTSWDSATAATTGSALVDESRTAVAGNLRLRLPELVTSVDARLQEGFLSTEGGLRSVLQRADAKRSTLVAAMHGEARRQVLEALKQISAGAAEGDASQGMLACLASARPRLDRCGGTQRLLAIAPTTAGGALVSALQQAADSTATVVNDSDADLVLCYEAQQLWIPYVAARLIGDRGDLADIALRLHTRSDVSWSDLADAAPLEAPEAEGAEVETAAASPNEFEPATAE